MTKERIVYPIMHMVLIVTLIISSLLIWATDGHALDIGDSAPDFQAATIDGKGISYYKDIKGRKPAYLLFWATW